jgi:hypothetical protein
MRGLGHGKVIWKVLVCIQNYSSPLLRDANH